MALWTNFIPASTIWFEISGLPRQIAPRHVNCAVLAHGTQIAKVCVVEIAIHVIDQDLLAVFGPEPA